MRLQACQQPAGWLSASEQQRLAGLETGRQSLFVACRYALRLLLAHPDGLVRDWRLGSAAERGPWVESPLFDRDRPQPQLSLAHSRGWLACAKAPVPVGVDLEVQPLTRQRDIAALAALVCTSTEQSWLLSQPGALQSRHFLQLWCLKEAYFKCLGTGLDWAQIRRHTWRQAPDVSVEGAAATAPTAYAYLWQGRTSAAEQMVLALCARQPLPGPNACLLEWPEEVERECISAWQLYAEPMQI